MIHFYSFISWYVSGWRPCSRTCGKGVQTREIVCRQEVSRGQFNTLPDSQCTDAKPTDPPTQDCNKIDCPAEKVPGDWSAVRNFSSVNMSYCLSSVSCANCAVATQEKATEQYFPSVWLRSNCKKVKLISDFIYRFSVLLHVERESKQEQLHVSGWRRLVCLSLFQRSCVQLQLLPLSKKPAIRTYRVQVLQFKGLSQDLRFLIKPVLKLK